MIVIVKSAPDTTDGMRGVSLARETGATLMLLQSGVYFAIKGLGVNLPDISYVLEEDRRLRGIKDDEMHPSAKTIGYEGLVDLMAGDDKVIGMF